MAERLAGGNRHPSDDDARPAAGRRGAGRLARLARRGVEPVGRVAVLHPRAVARYADRTAAPPGRPCSWSLATAGLPCGTRRHRQDGRSAAPSCPTRHSSSRWGSPARDWRAARRCAATRSSCWPRWRSAPWRDARTSCCRPWTTPRPPPTLALDLGAAAPAGPPRRPPRRDLAVPWLGALSYCIYLANQPVHKLLGLFLAGAAGGDGAVFTALWLPGAVVLPVVLSVGLHRWIETPALRWGRRYARRAH